MQNWITQPMLVVINTITSVEFEEDHYYMKIELVVPIIRSLFRKDDISCYWKLREEILSGDKSKIYQSISK